jgi:cytidylate kinase
MTSASAAPVIAIDGPAASGKGTVAKGVARTLGFHYLDSGSLYRLVALKALRDAIPLDHEAPLAAAARDLNVEFAGEAIRLDGSEPSTAIREEQVSAAASWRGGSPGRAPALLSRQRVSASTGSGRRRARHRDRCLPGRRSAQAYVTASAEERARRRYNQLIEKGNSVTLDGLLRDIRERDARDSARAAAPLKAAATALILDTTDVTIDAAIAFVVQKYRVLAAAERR